MSRAYVARSPEATSLRRPPIWTRAEMLARQDDLLRRRLWRYCVVCQKFRPCWLIVPAGQPHGGYCAACVRVAKHHQARIEARLLQLAEERMRAVAS